MATAPCRHAFHLHDRLMQELIDVAESLSIDPGCVPHLIGVFNELGALQCFTHVPGAEDIVILNPQWLIDSMVCGYLTQPTN